MTLADDDTKSILAGDANRAIWVDGCHLDGGRAQCGLGGHQGGLQAGVLLNYDNVGDNIYVVGPWGGSDCH